LTPFRGEVKKYLQKGEAPGGSFSFRTALHIILIFALVF
jgi:hypothetical protein